MDNARVSTTLVFLLGCGWQSTDLGSDHRYKVGTLVFWEALAMLWEAQVINGIVGFLSTLQYLFIFFASVMLSIEH